MTTEIKNNLPTQEDWEKYNEYAMRIQLLWVELRMYMDPMEE